MLAQLLWITLTVLCLFALAAGARVLGDIVREGRERRRKWRTGEMKRYGGEENDADSAPGGATCRHCGAENAPGFTYCRDCAKRL